MHQAKRHLWLMLSIAAIVLLTRSWLITRAQSERIDDEYHIQRGVMFLERTLANQQAFKLNDPPLGEALGVLPLWLAGNWSKQAPGTRSFIWGQKFHPDTILNVIGLWKSLLLLPMLAVVFIWVRQLYGLRAAWLATALIPVEPTIAAHTPLPSVDVLGMEGIVIAAFLAWRYFQSPGVVRLIVAAIAMAAAMLLKHTAIMLPAIVLLYAILCWIIEPLRQKQLKLDWSQYWRPRLGHVLLAAVVVPLSIWAMLMFDISRPYPPPRETIPFRREYPILGDITQLRMPAGMYVTSVLQAQWHVERGHPSYLFRKRSKNGTWEYFPIVATYKIPIAIGVLMLMGAASFYWRRPDWQEASLLVPMIVITLMMLNSSINIGWRHFLPAEIFMLMLAARIVADRETRRLRFLGIAAGVLVALAWVDTLRYHPNYLAYISFPRTQGWRDISDSNVDWGQGLKSVKRWIDQNTDLIGDRRVYLCSYAYAPKSVIAANRLGDEVTILDRDPTLPGRGILIISVVDLMGMYEMADWYKPLRDQKPIADLDHSMLVYDLDKLRSRARTFNWGPRPTPRGG